MNSNEYLQAILVSQDLKDDSLELKELQAERAKVERLLRDAFGWAPVIRYGGSKAKGTLIKECYDLDLVCYSPCNDNSVGETLEDIYRNARDVLRKDYSVEEKTSSLRLKGKDPKDFNRDFHIDVIPGRFTDEARADCFIYQRSADKCRLKTNLQVHIGHIKESGLLDAIRLLKLWKVRKALCVRQFAFELFIIDLLHGMRGKPVDEQLTSVWAQIKSCSDPITVVDPANPTGNDLSPILVKAWPEMVAVSASTLSLLEKGGWEQIFGQPVKSTGIPSAPKLQRIAASISTPYKPWCRDDE